MRKTFLLAMASLLLFAQCKQETNYVEKHVIFPENTPLEEKIDVASRIVPTAQQLEWQKMELTAFLHFGMNTFTGNEWGSGKENPELFHPTNFDADQWVQVLKKAGFKMALITAKHHDGFCLWPTATTKHSVVSSKWMDGKGDIVKALKEACDKHGLRFGVYLSPWDRNADCYGSDAYNDMFVAQLTELLTNYGDVYEVWFDGACGEGPNGKKQVYDWDRILKKIRELQPKAVTAIMGDDVRWVGNEAGVGRETEWSVTPLIPSSYARSEAECGKLGINGMSKDIGSRELIEKANELFWYPSEVDVSIRPGWFYHKEQDSQVKSLQHLVNIYYQSVGYNSVLLLNIPPDREGRISQADETRLYEFQDYIRNSFANNLVKDGNQAWTAQVDENKDYELDNSKSFNTIMLQEDITKGQRVEMFNVEALIDGNWLDIASGTTIGHKRLIRTPDLKAEKLRVTIKHSRNVANISTVGAFYAEPLQPILSNVEVNQVDTKTWKVISPKDMPRSTFEGTEISGFELWTDEFTVPVGGEDKHYKFDEIVIDMGKTQELSGFTYTPGKREGELDYMFYYRFYVSVDGKDWHKCDTYGEFSNITNNPITQYVRFSKKMKGRYFMFEPVESAGGSRGISVGKIGVLVK